MSREQERIRKKLENNPIVEYNKGEKNEFTRYHSRWTVCCKECFTDMQGLSWALYNPV